MQHVSTPLSHHQALHRSTVYHISQCILGSQMFTMSNMVDAVLYVLMHRHIQYCINHFTHCKHLGSQNAL